MKKTVLVAFSFLILGIFFWFSRVPDQHLKVLLTTKIVVAFGYKDTRPARLVGDRYERAILVKKLVGLGFQRNPNDDDLFEYENSKERFQLTVFNSATGPDDEENRKDPYQYYKTEEAWKLFLESLRTADIVLYNGHSRDGGGPDFAPPQLNTRGQVDYAHYRKEKRYAKLPSQLIYSVDSLQMILEIISRRMGV